MSSSRRSLIMAGVGVGMSMKTARVVELLNFGGGRSRMSGSYIDSTLALPRRCRSRQFSSSGLQPTPRLGPRPLLSQSLPIQNLRYASSQAATVSRIEEDEQHMENDERLTQEEEEEQDQRMRYRDSSSDVKRGGWMESPVRLPQQKICVPKAKDLQDDGASTSPKASHPSPPEQPDETLPNQLPSALDPDLLTTLTTLSSHPITSLLHQLDSSDLRTLSQRLITVHAIRPLRIIVDTISTDSSADESSAKTVLDVLLESEERKLPDALKKLVFQLVHSLPTEGLDRMITGMPTHQVAHLVDSLISTNVDDPDIMAEKLEIPVSTLAKDGLLPTATGVDISRRKTRIYLCFMSMVWFLQRNELEMVESLCKILENNDVLHRVSPGYEGTESSPHRQLINVSSEILISSREHLCKRDVHELMMSLQRLLLRERFKLQRGELPVQPWSDVVNLIIQDALTPGDRESFMEIQNFLMKTRFGSKVFPLRKEVRELLYSALDQIPPTPRWKIYQRLLRRGQPPPPGESTLQLAEHILQKANGKQSFHSPDLSLLNESLRIYRHTLSGCQWAEYIRILLRKRGYSKSACEFYDAALDDQEHCIDVAGDHRLTLAMAETLGSPRDERPPRNRAFAARVIREFAHASPSLFNLPRESLTSLAQSFVAIGAIEAAYKVFEYILKSPTPPTEMDVAALLASAFHRNPEIAVRLLEQAINSRAMSSRAALEVVLKATERVEDTALIERIKEVCKKMTRAGGGE